MKGLCHLARTPPALRLVFWLHVAYKCDPPVPSIIGPVIHRPSGEAVKATISAISEGSPMRPSADISTADLRPSGVCSHDAFYVGIDDAGHDCVHSNPRGPSSLFPLFYHIVYALCSTKPPLVHNRQTVPIFRSIV